MKYILNYIKMYKVWNIILVKFPFTNLADFKLRPALIIWEYAPKEVLLGNKNDYIILAISSNKDNWINSKIDSSDLSSGELLVKSYIKINKITSIEKSLRLLHKMIEPATFFHIRFQ